jgi:hypothetical protein
MTPAREVLARCSLCIPSARGLYQDTQFNVFTLAANGARIHQIGGSNIAYLRNTLTADFLCDDVRDWSLWVDDDVSAPQGPLVWLEWAAQAFERFPEGDAIVTGLYAVKAAGRRAFAGCFVEPSVPLGEGVGGYHRADWAGGGAVLVHRRAWRAMADHLGIPGEGRCRYHGSRGEVWFGPRVWRNGAHEEGDLDPVYPDRHVIEEDGEDVGLSAVARAAGIPIYTDTRLVLDHRGAHSFRWEDALAPVVPRQRALELAAPSMSIAHFQAAAPEPQEGSAS